MELVSDSSMPVTPSRLTAGADWLGAVPLSVTAAVLGAVAVAVLGFVFFTRRSQVGPSTDASGAAPSGEGDPERAQQILTPTFPERPLEDVERTFERLIARGEFEVQRATAEDRARARTPAHSGPVFRRIAGTYRTIRLVAADVTLDLHRGSIVEDPLGGWRFHADPPEIDIRLAGAAPERSGDEILDATWSPKSRDEVVVHSSILHFVVRAAIGDAG